MLWPGIDINIVINLLRRQYIQKATVLQEYDSGVRE